MDRSVPASKQDLNERLYLLNEYTVLGALLNQLSDYNVGSMSNMDDFDVSAALENKAASLRRQQQQQQQQRRVQRRVRQKRSDRYAGESKRSWSRIIFILCCCQVTRIRKESSKGEGKGAGVIQGHGCQSLSSGIVVRSSMAAQSIDAKRPSSIIAAEASA